MAKRQLQCALTSHTHSQQRDPRTGDAEIPFNERYDRIQQPVLGRLLRLKLQTDHVQPPTAAAIWTDSHQPMLLKQATEDQVFMQEDAPMTVQKKDCGLRWRLGLRHKDIDAATVNRLRPPAVQDRCITGCDLHRRLLGWCFCARRWHAATKDVPEIIKHRDLMRFYQAQNSSTRCARAAGLEGFCRTAGDVEFLRLCIAAHQWQSPT